MKLVRVDSIGDLNRLGVLTSYALKFRDERGDLLVRFEGISTVGSLRDRQISFKSSVSKATSFRGFHIQKKINPQSKLTMLRSGKIIQFFIDLDRSSELYGTVFYVNVSAEDKVSIFIPDHYAHGYFATEESSFDYICFGAYDVSSELAISPLPVLNALSLKAIISLKDQQGLDLDRFLMTQN